MDVRVFSGRESPAAHPRIGAVVDRRRCGRTADPARRTMVGAAPGSQRRTEHGPGVRRRLGALVGLPRCRRARLAGGRPWGRGLVPLLDALPAAGSLTVGGDAVRPARGSRGLLPFPRGLQQRRRRPQCLYKVGGRWRGPGRGVLAHLETRREHREAAVRVRRHSLVALAGLGSPEGDGVFVARLRYAQTKIDNAPDSIPVEADVVGINLEPLPVPEMSRVCRLRVLASCTCRR